MEEGVESVEPGKRPDRITFEVLTPGELIKVIDATISEEVLQNLAAIKMTTPLIPTQEGQSLEEAANSMESLVTQTMGQLKAIQRILTQDPSEPIPIDHRYETAKDGKPVLALDIIMNRPQK